MLSNNRILVLGVVVIIVLIFVVIYRHRQRKLNEDFNDQPRGRDGEVFDDDNENDEELPPSTLR